jgi:hypothetical protein
MQAKDYIFTALFEIRKLLKSGRFIAEIPACG